MYVITCVILTASFFSLYTNISHSKPVSLGMATTPPALLRGGSGVVLEYSNGSKCKGNIRWKSTLILTCDPDAPIVSSLPSNTQIHVFMYVNVYNARSEENL